MTVAITRAAMVGLAFTDSRVAISAIVVGEHRMLVVGQQPIDGAFAQSISQDLPRILEAGLDPGTTDRHARNSSRDTRRTRIEDATTSAPS